MITKAKFEENNTNSNTANIIEINTRANKNVLAPISSTEGAGISSQDENDQIEYMDETSDETLVSSNSENGWINVAIKNPC